MSDQVLWFGGAVVIVIGAIALLLWSGDDRPSWGDDRVDEADVPHGRPHRTHHHGHSHGDDHHGDSDGDSGDDGN